MLEVVESLFGGREVSRGFCSRERTLVGKRNGDRQVR